VKIDESREKLRLIRLKLTGKNPERNDARRKTLVR
jgi:hypothetical protein